MDYLINYPRKRKERIITPSLFVLIDSPPIHDLVVGAIVRHDGGHQRRSQGLSSLPPLVAAGHVTTCDTNYSTGVESTIIFVDLKWLKRKKGHRMNYTFDIFQSCCKLHTGQAKCIYTYLAY